MNAHFLFCFVVLGLHCSALAFSSCRELGLLSVAGCGLLIVVASLVVEHGCVGFSRCGAWAWLPCNMWGLSSWSQGSSPRPPHWQVDP